MESRGDGEALLLRSESGVTRRLMRKPLLAAGEEPFLGVGVDLTLYTRWFGVVFLGDLWEEEWFRDCSRISLRVPIFLKGVDLAGCTTSVVAVTIFFFFGVAEAFLPLLSTRTSFRRPIFLKTVRRLEAAGVPGLFSFSLEELGDPAAALFLTTFFLLGST